MEIKIGIQHVVRELTVETEETAANIEASLRKALADDGVVALTDEKGRKVLVPAAQDRLHRPRPGQGASGGLRLALTPPHQGFPIPCHAPGSAAARRQPAAR